MAERPTIQTPRLSLRPFTLMDASEVQRLAGDRDIAVMAQNIPHLYEDGLAEQWNATYQAQCEAGEGVSFAIVLRVGQPVIGAVSLRLDLPHARAELGACIGKPNWRQGCATEAGAAVLHYGFEVLGCTAFTAVISSAIRPPDACRRNLA